MNINKYIRYLILLAGIGIISFALLVNSFAQTPAKPTIQESKPPAQAESQIKPEQVKTPEKQSSEDYYSAGQNIDVKSENAAADVVVAGTNVTISGDVKGYLMAAGANVNVNAPIGNDLWAVGANVVVNAPIADNAMLAGSSVVLEQNATIGKDARIAAGSVDVKSRIGRNLNISAGNIQISSEVGGNVTVFAENFTLNPGTIVQGDLIVNSPNPPSISSQAKVNGRVEHRVTQSSQDSNYKGGGWFSSWFLTFLWITVLGLAAVWFSTVWTNRVAEMLKKDALKSLLVGMVTALVVPFVFVILLVTVIGLPLAFILGAMSFVGFMLSGVFVAYFVGEWVLNLLKRWQDSNVLKIIFGALIITIVMSLPWIGWLAKLAVFFFGFGAFLLERRDLFRQLRAQGLA